MSGGRTQSRLLSCVGPDVPVDVAQRGLQAKGCFWEVSGGCILSPACFAASGPLHLPSLPPGVLFPLSHPGHPDLPISPPRHLLLEAPPEYVPVLGSQSPIPQSLTIISGNSSLLDSEPPRAGLGRGSLQEPLDAGLIWVAQHTAALGPGGVRGTHHFSDDQHPNAKGSKHPPL